MNDRNGQRVAGQFCHFHFGPLALWSLGLGADLLWLCALCHFDVCVLVASQCRSSELLALIEVFFN